MRILLNNINACQNAVKPDPVAPTSSSAPVVTTVGAASEAETPPSIDAGALFGSAQIVLIRHGGDTYRLCRTRQGKLILTK